METDALLSTLDKYGPLGVALIVVCVVLYLFVVRVLPMVAESHGKRLDSLIDAFKQAMGLVNEKLDTHEVKAEERHGEIKGGLREISEKIDRRWPEGGRKCPDGNNSSSA